MGTRLRRWVQRIARETVADELAPHAASMEASVQASLEANQQAILERLDAAARSADDRADERDAQLAGAIHSLADAIDRLGGHLDDQQALVDRLTERTDLLMREIVLAGIGRSAAPELLEARPTVLGGTFGPADGSLPEAIDLRHDGDDGPLVQVWSHFQGVWASGFRLLGVVDEEHGRTVRVARISDRYELPIRFAADEVRLAGDRSAVQGERS